jgi:hypothetical protein
MWPFDAVVLHKKVYVILVWVKYGSFPGQLRLLSAAAAVGIATRWVGGVKMGNNWLHLATAGDEAVCNFV